MVTVFDIDTHLRHILEPQHNTLGKVQRHKLCYAVLRLGIGVTGESPFDGRVLAWPLGPVFEDLWDHPDRDGDPNNIPAEVREIDITVAARLGGVPGEKLAASSHRRYPEWRIARKGLPISKCGNNEITRELIRSVTYDQVHVEGYGKNQVITINQPHDPALFLIQWRDLGFNMGKGEKTLFRGGLPFKDRSDV
jgi:uncharacterized phage-associated protein